MPRVGSTANDRAPLWTSIRSVPSRRPPRKVRLRTDQSCGVGRRGLSLPTAKLSSQMSLTTSVRVQVLKRVMEGAPRRHSPAFVVQALEERGQEQDRQAGPDRGDDEEQEEVGPPA